MNNFLNFIKLIWDYVLMFIGVSFGFGWIFLIIFFLIFDGYDDFIPVSLTIVSIILVIAFITYQDEKKYKEILEKSKEYNGISLADFCLLVYSPYFNKKEKFKKFLPKLHVTYKLLAESEGLDIDSYKTYNPDSKNGLFQKIDSKPYLSQNKIKSKKDLDQIIQNKEYTTPSHLIRDLQFILNHLNEDELRLFFSDENNKKRVISSFHCKLFLNEKIISTSDENTKSFYKLLISNILMEEQDCIRSNYKDLGYTLK